MTNRMLCNRMLCAAVMAAMTFTLGACSGGSEPDDATPTSESAGDTASTPDPNSDAELGLDDEGEAELGPPPPPAFDVLATEPTEAGPRPLLAWAAVDGAVAYDLIVLDAQGTPYWAWTGESTSVHLGGVENPDAVGAWVFEPLTWIVTARDAAGQPLAMSEQAALLP